MAAAVNGNTNLQNSGITASASGVVVTLQSKSTSPTTYRQSFNSTATESILIAPAKYGWQVLAVGGTKTTGNVVSVVVYDIGLTGGSKTINYTVVAADTLTTIATNLASAITADSSLSALGISATSSATVVSLKSLSPNLTTYVASVSAGGTETLSLGTGIGVMRADHNLVNELVSLSPGGAALFKGDTDKPVSSATINSQILNLQSTPPATPTSFLSQVKKIPTETLSFSNPPGGYTSGTFYYVTVGGTITTGSTLTMTVTDARLVNGSETVSYTTVAGDTTSSVATALVNAVHNDPVLTALTYDYLFSGSQVGIGTHTPNHSGPLPFGISGTVVDPGSEVVTLSTSVDGSTAATITGTVTTGDTASLTVKNANLASGQKTIQYVVVGGDTTTSIATGLKNAINSDTSLQAIGVQATSSANVLSILPFTYTTGSSSGTETVTVNNANRGNAAITIGGSVTTGNTVTITPHNPALAGGLKNIVYTVVSGDTLASISKSLAALINADTSLQAIGLKVANSASQPWSQSFSGNALLPSGSSIALATAIDGSSNTKTNGYALSVNGATSSTLTYDLNGNMTSDGTNTYSWDAENRMIKITYPGVNNFSTFGYDGLSRNVSIVETTAGSVTSTKQFVISGLLKCEQRDSFGVISQKAYTFGEITNIGSRFQTFDHQLSVREFTNTSANLVSQLQYDLYGKNTFLVGSERPSRLFANYYSHDRSNLLLTANRAYDSTAGHFITRDIYQGSETNLYNYCVNNPVSYWDPAGNKPSMPSMFNPGGIKGTAASIINEYFPDATKTQKECLQNCLQHQIGGAVTQAAIDSGGSGDTLTTMRLGLAVEIYEFVTNKGFLYLSQEFNYADGIARYQKQLDQSLSVDTAMDLANDLAGANMQNIHGGRLPGPGGGGGSGGGDSWGPVIQSIIENCAKGCRCKPSGKGK